MLKPTVLFYDPHGAEWGGKLRQVCAIQGLRLRAVEDGDLGRGVLSLAEGTPTAEAVQPFPPLPEPMLVLCGLGGAHLDRLLQGLRKAGVPRACLKAVLTGENSRWPLHTLYEELVRERDAVGS